MSVLSDNQIAQLCKPYTFMVESSRNQPALPGIPEEPEKFFPTDRSEEEIKAWIENKTLFVLGDGSNSGAHSAKSYRPLTEEERVKYSSSKMIYPFLQKSVKLNDQGNKALSFGLGSYGYDVRLDKHFKIFSNLNGGVIDPKRLDNNTMVDVEAKKDEYGDDYVILPPHSYLLGSTIETFNIPRDVICIALGKSTAARVGLIVNVTPIEPGFQGRVVIEIANSTSLPIKVYANEGIAQFVFFRGTEPCKVSYADKEGKYQGQSGLQMAIV